MVFIDELNTVKQLVEEEGYISEMIVQHLAERKIYHSIAVMIMDKTFNFGKETSRELIYSHDFYAKYKNEKNPFNENLLDDKGNLKDSDNELD